MGDDQRVDRFLRQGVARALLGDRDALRVAGAMIEHARIDQPVMDDDVGRGERLDGAHRQQPRIAWARADENHTAA
jgi:hypothetical protein